MINVSNGFNRVANGSVRPLATGVNISWTKERASDISWFTLNASQLDGSDIVAQDTTDPIQLWDSYDYKSETDRVIEVNWSRSVEFPYNVQTALADFKLNNYDGRYDFNGDSDIAEYILPKRPVRLYAGFKVNGATELIPQFVGMTERLPSYSGKDNTTAKFKATDFMSQIADFKLEETVMSRDIRTDEAIEIILQQFGLDSSMYNLEHGVNTIPFFYVAKGKDAGNIIKKLVQAENGSLWLDEKGIVRFEPRTAVIGQEPVMQFNESNIISITPSRESGIVNSIKVKSDVRKIMQNQQVFTITNDNGYQSENDSYRVGANGSLVIWASFDDPLWTGNVNPTFNGADDDSNFTALDLAGNKVSSNVIVQGTLFAEDAKLVIINTNNYPISINFLSIWGEPAKVEDTLDYEAYDDVSIEKFGEQKLEITDNEYFGNYENIDSYADYVLSHRKDYSPTINMEVKGNPALQLGDLIEIDHKSAVREDYNYKVVGLQYTLGSKGLKTKITADYFGAILKPFILDVSRLNSTDVLG